MNENLNEHQKAAIEALEELKRICDKYQLKFYLLAGTALGAVRHKGMIPWDDDIDVGFLYEDLEKLKKVISLELNDKFEYVSYENKKNFPRIFGAVTYQRKSCIDLFLIAKWTTNKVESFIHFQINRFALESYHFSIGYKERIKSNSSSKLLIKKIIRIIRKCMYFPFSWAKPDFFLKIIRWNERCFENKGDCYINLYSIYGLKKELILKEWIEKPVEVIFEEKKYLTLGFTHDYLTKLYGDYLTPPPINERFQNRHDEIF